MTFDRWVQPLADFWRFSWTNGSRLRRTRRYGSDRSCSAEPLEQRCLLAASTLTPSEQLLLELTNRARANPSAEASRQNLGLNVGVSAVVPPASPITTAAKPPLAPNNALGVAADGHTADMLRRGFFAHVSPAPNSTDFDTRILSAGYTFTTAGENLAVQAYNTLNQTTVVTQMHNGLYASAAHRLNMMRDTFFEAGIGIDFGSFRDVGNVLGGGANARHTVGMTTVKFGTSATRPFLTGVVYTDASDGSANDNSFYSIGEQAGAGGSVTATNVSTGAEFSEVIGAAGGYSIAVPAGTYNVVATGGNLPDTYVVSDVTVGTTNVKVDFETTTATVAPAIPIVNLSVSANAGAESDQTVITVLATASEAVVGNQTVDVQVSGTGITSDDYRLSDTTITIPAGATSGSVTFTVVDDFIAESMETAVVSLANASAGITLAPTATQDIAITSDADNTLRVASTTLTHDGFVMEFTEPVDVALINVAQNPLHGEADLVVEAADLGVVTGSLSFSADTRTVTFMSSSGALAADTYTITLRSAANGWAGPGAKLLDGNADGTGGDDFTTELTVAAVPSGTIIASLPRFTRGAGQPVTLPRTEGTATGIPLTLSSGRNISSVSFTLNYNPALLEMTGFVSEVAGATATIDVSTPGVAVVTLSTATQLATVASELVVGHFLATVPANAPYSHNHILEISNLSVLDNQATPVAVNAVGDDGMHVAAYFGDLNGDGNYGGVDVLLLQRIIAQLSNGASAFPTVDPILLSDITGDGGLSGNDALSIQRVIAQLPMPNIPALPNTALGQSTAVAASGAVVAEMIADRWSTMATAAPAANEFDVNDRPPVPVEGGDVEQVDAPRESIASSFQWPLPDEETTTRDLTASELPSALAGRDTDLQNVAVPAQRSRQWLSTVNLTGR